jgi:hypothetical protein
MMLFSEIEPGGWLIDQSARMWSLESGCSSIS